jgi:acyl-CoA synthetase (AMP-forming)/AMP-acid ligase II
MPLFHIHGLVGSLMATLASGGSVACTSRFDPEAFFDQVAEFEPTWFSAVPSMHQALVANGRAYRERAPLHRFRFARSSSASLPPTTLAALEALLECPVIEAYGMTEASHQIASNPLPPRERRAGSVGLPVGAEVAILDESGAELPHGQTGEIAIRGGSVTAGYENNPEANAGAFVRGWFRTGDQGRRDADGYLHIVGRLKEMINRGGEKISPREIDEALLELPGVAQAVAFGFPHPTLGEDVAAALVLEPGAPADAGVVKRALLSRLSAHKVPSRIVFVDRLPKTTTGKVQRMSLHKILPERSREASATEEDPPMSDAERAVASIWCEVLGVESVHARDNFFDLGGDSIRARRAIALIAKRTGKRLPARQMVHLTLAQIAAELPRAKSTRMEKVRQLVRGA